MEPKQKKNNGSTYHSFNAIFIIATYNFFATGRKLQLAFHLCLCLHFHFTFTHYTGSLTETIKRKFREISKIRRDQIWRFEKRSLFLIIAKQRHNLARYYKRGNLVSYFQNNAAKTCIYGLRISQNIEIEHVFQSKTLFHLSSNLHTSFLSVFKVSHFCDHQVNACSFKKTFL